MTPPTAGDELAPEAIAELRALGRLLGACAEALRPLRARGTLVGDLQRRIALLMADTIRSRDAQRLSRLVPRLLEAELPAGRRLLELAAEVLLRDDEGQEGSQEGWRPQETGQA